MRVCKNAAKAVLMSVIGLLPVSASAGEYGVRVRSVAFSQSPAQTWQLSVRLDFRLSRVATDAVLHGVPLSWQVKLRWLKTRKFWWDEIRAEKTIPLTLQYQALLNQFAVRRGDKPEVEMFASLNNALAEMSRLQVNLGTGSVGTEDKIAIKVVFDREALPTPLRPEAWLSQQWDLSSDWSVWPFQK